MSRTTHHYTLLHTRAAGALQNCKGQWSFYAFRCSLCSPPMLSRYLLPFPLTVFPSWCPPFPASPQPFHIPFCGVSGICLCFSWLPHTSPAHRPRLLTPLPRSFSIMRRRFRTGLRRPRNRSVRPHRLIRNFALF